MPETQWRSPRRWLALALLVAAWFALPPLEEALRAPVAHRLGLHMIQGGALTMGPFAWEMAVRLVLNLALLAAVLVILARPLLGFPLADAQAIRRLGLGATTGLAVMVLAILAILVCGAARIGLSAQPVWMAAVHGLGWFAVDLLGAAGEEIYGRGAVLLVAATFLGWRGALIVSGLVFLALHLGNPGASPVWLARLFFQGVLLAYAVVRTRSLWWSIGYHAGWNWASAPLFGAAGSGYLDKGHIFDFLPQGPAWITGGAVGPEGSLFAFLAVFTAAALLFLTTRNGQGRTPHQL